MSYNTEKWLCIGLIAFLVWLVVSRMDIHTGGDETVTVTDSRSAAVAFSLVGNPSISVEQGGAGASGDKKTITIICPHCEGVIAAEQ